MIEREKKGFIDSTGEQEGRDALEPELVCQG